MKRHLHLLLLLLLSLALPLNGVAGLLVFSEPCPMEQQGHSMDDRQGTCCDDQQKPLSSNKVCKAGQDCKTNSAVQISVIKTEIIASSQPAHSLTLDFFSTPTPSDFWRPPRA
ncbi:hypothetical protein IIE18_11830 [Pseudomonas sp. V1]|uniref:hypothetical protein n=1 Tax=Pseudomonas arcuscaelestis TaxID=2710591 RepID=UPI00193F9F00|nr:hypothetical protein [Pseudomonas arcuscaelestis]MBM3105828.1 hypothetical protein [Pseudomonas arcuscaelestis]